MGVEEILYLRFAQHDARADLEPQLHRVRADHDGRGLRRRDRGHFYDPVGALRDVVVNHLMQVVAAAAMEPPSRRRPDDAQGRPVAVFRAVVDADPAHYVRGQYDGYRRSTVSPPTRRPRPTQRCGSTSRTGAGPGCRSSSAPASGCRQPDRDPGRLQTAPEARLRLTSAAQPEPDQLVIRLDPPPASGS